MKFLDLDSPFMRVLGRMTDLLWLNLLTVLLLIPIVTGGAALTALHYSCLKLIRGEEGYVTKDYFNSFKANFKQATIIWLIVIFFTVLLGFDFWYVYQLIGAEVMTGTSATLMLAALFAAAIFGVFTVLYVFPVLAHFTNTIRGTIKNSFYMSILALPKTLLMIVYAIVPAALWILSEQYTSISLFPVSILFWFSAPAYFSAMLYNKTFKKYEPEEKDINDDFSWTVGGEGENPEAENTEAAEDFSTEQIEELGEAAVKEDGAETITGTTDGQQ